MESWAQEHGTTKESTGPGVRRSISLCGWMVASPRTNGGASMHMETPLLTYKCRQSGDHLQECHDPQSICLPQPPEIRFRIGIIYNIKHESPVWDFTLCIKMLTKMIKEF